MNTPHPDTRPLHAENAPTAPDRPPTPDRSRPRRAEPAGGIESPHRADRARRARGTWIGPTAALWWALGAVAALVVTLTGGTLPVGDADATGFSALSAVRGEALTPWVAVLALAGAALAAWTWRGGRTGPTPRGVRIATCAAVGVVLAGSVVLVDASILARIGYLPVTAIMAPFDADLRAAFADFLTPGVLLQLAVLLGAGLLAASTTRFARRAVGACESCGRRHDGADPAWTTPASAARWGRAAALVAAAAPLFYAVTRIAWVLGIPLGFSPDDVAALAGDDGWIAALGLGAFALVGAVLTLGLFQRWGEVFPRWMLGLAGRRVPVNLAVIPATIVAVAVLPAGLSLVALGLGDEKLAITADSWGAVGPTLLWPLWSVALGAATYAYWLRRRGTCVVCGRG
ncbi:hypothetical protein V5D56_02825 [Cellulosimicrobium sp. PMB13]|uniref:hypothetical protein n=1 Tax=Cellulosimicrobium sp. PMB13 TaxID=3120158 RepID=UPI003F4BD45F